MQMLKEGYKIKLDFILLMNHKKIIGITIVFEKLG